jgi:UDP:flavonoid glycosyltransferase YjiC (YdhE family)
MRVAFVGSAWLTHLLPMVPLAQACRAAGHPVWLAVPPALAGPARDTGLPTVPLGGDVDYRTPFRRVLHHAPAPGTGQGAPARRPRVFDLFASVAAAMVRELANFVTRDRIDLLVFEPTAVVAPIVAAMTGIPAVRFRFGPDALRSRLPALSEALEELPGGPRELHVGPDALVGGLTLDPCPPALREADDPDDTQTIRYHPRWPGGPLPERPASGRPRICVSWGSTLSGLDPAAYLAGDAARALAGLDVEVLVGCRPEQHRLLGPLPDNATALPGVALDQLVPSCDAVVSQGGSGVILTATLAGLPQVTVPRMPDHRFHSRRLVASGAGRSIPPSDLPDRLATEVLELLGDRPARAAAAALGADMRAAPSPADLVDRLVRLAGASVSGSEVARR